MQDLIIFGTILIVSALGYLCGNLLKNDALKESGENISIIMVISIILYLGMQLIQK